MRNPPNSRPNMQQIADAVGFSKSAVSLALRNDPRLPVATRQRIQSIAEKMGYRRNPVVDSLMTQLRAGRQPRFLANLGLVNCSPLEDLNKNHTFRRLREGVFARAWICNARTARCGGQVCYVERRCSELADAVSLFLRKAAVLFLG